MFDFNEEKIKKISMSYAYDLCKPTNNHLCRLLLEEQGEPYKLYAHISSQLNNITILDVGTYNGNSALAFSYNETNNIISYDIVENGASSISRKNITWKIKDFRDDDSINFDEVSIILIDVDPHDGIQEIEMIKYLKDKKWSGVLLLDDIHHNNGMENFWKYFPEEVKTDLTHIGHYSGTGMVMFS